MGTHKNFSCRTQPSTTFRRRGDGWKSVIIHDAMHHTRWLLHKFKVHPSVRPFLHSSRVETGGGTRGGPRWGPQEKKGNTPSLQSPLPCGMERVAIMCTNPEKGPHWLSQLNSVFWEIKWKYLRTQPFLCVWDKLKKVFESYIYLQNHRFHILTTTITNTIKYG